MQKPLTSLPPQIIYSLAEAAHELNLSPKELVYYGSLRQVELCWLIPNQFSCYSVFVKKIIGKDNKETLAIMPNYLSREPYFAATKMNVNALALSKSDCEELLLQSSIEKNALFSSGYSITRKGIIEKIFPWQCSADPIINGERLFSISKQSTSIINPLPFKQEIINISFDKIIVIREQLELLKAIINNHQTAPELETVDNFYTHKNKSEHLIKLEQAAKIIFNSTLSNSTSKLKEIEKILKDQFGFNPSLAKSAAIIIHTDNSRANESNTISDTQTQNYRSEKFKCLIDGWEKFYANADLRDTDTFQPKLVITQWFRNLKELEGLVESDAKHCDDQTVEVKDFAYQCATLIRPKGAKNGRRKSNL